MKASADFFNLTALRTDSTLGYGVYVMVSVVAKSITGPTVKSSFEIPTVVSKFPGKTRA